MVFLDLFFPKNCLACGKYGFYVCADCVAGQRKAKGLCVMCQKPSIDGVTHIRCKKPWSLDGSISIWRYEGVIRKAILKLKYKFAYEIAEELSDYAVNYLRKETNALPKDALIIPVAMHRRRYNWRGFNQSGELSKLISSKLEWKYSDRIIRRNINTKPQTELKGSERRKNVRKAFSLNINYKKLVSESEPIVVFDDVLTTGATVREVAKVLKRSGAKVVWGLTIAR